MDRMATSVTTRATGARRALAIAIAAVSVPLILLGWVVSWVGEPSEFVAPHPLELARVILLVALAFPVVGLVLALRVPRNPIGWMFLAFGLAIGLQVALGLYADHHWYHGQPPLPADNWAAWLSSWMVGASFWVVPALLPLLYPTGAPPGPRWRPLLYVACVGIVMQTLGEALSPDTLAPYGLRNPIGTQAGSYLTDGSAPFLVAALLGGLAALVFRFRRAQGDERLQIKWLALLGALVAVFLVLGGSAQLLGSSTWDDIFWMAAISCFLLLPVATGVAILRHRLYDIDLLVNRALVYGALTALVAVGYVAVVALCGLVLHREAGLGASLVATATIALLFGPVRTRLQRGANRLLYGQRDEPYAAVANLGTRLSATENADATLRALAETVAQALRLPYAAVELRHGGRLERIAATGRPPWAVTRIPLAYGGEELGAIAVCPRAPGESFNAADRHLLSELARQAAAAAHAILLADDLQRARERIVTAREEERRHIRHELHDRVGPSLAGMTLQLDALRRLAGQDAETAAEAVRALRLEAAGALDDVRALARGLRPPVLDALGLLGALGQLGEDCAPLEVRLDVRDELQTLPAATEVAAYRIAQDVLAQLADTPGARSATLRLRGGQALELEFTAEDVAGGELSVPVATAVRERAEELGGSCASEPRLTGGRRLRARLPLAVEAVA